MNVNSKIFDADLFISQNKPSPSNLPVYLEKIKHLIDSDCHTVEKVKSVRILTDKLDSPSVNLNAFYGWDHEGVTLRLTTFKCICVFFNTKGISFDNAIEFLKLAIRQILYDGREQEIDDCFKLLKLWEETPQIKRFKELLSLKKIAKQMYPRAYRTTSLLLDALLSDNLDEAIPQTAFKILYLAKELIENMPKNNRHAVRKPIDHEDKWDSNSRKAVGVLFLSSLHKDEEREIWDFFHYSTLIMELLHFARDPEQVQQIADLFKWVRIDLKTVILNELSTVSNIAELIRKLQALKAGYQQNTPRSLAIMSQIYPFQTDSYGSDNTLVWVDSVEGQGFLIGCFGQTKFLFNTALGIVDTGPGAAFDIVLLDKTKDRLLFKILKRDGWILFDTKKHVDHRYFDSIQLTSNPKSLRSRNALVKHRMGKLDVSFEGKVFTINGIEAGHIYGSKVPFLAIRSTDRTWRFLNLQSEEICSLSSPVISLQPVRGTASFAEGLTEEGDKILCRFDDYPKLIAIFSESDKVLFSLFDDGVLVQHQAGQYREITKEGNIKIVPDRLYQKLERFHLTDRSLQLRSFGVMLSNNKQGDPVVRYDFEMELQGRYHISKDDQMSLLWFHTTIRMDEGLPLIKSNGDISLLGVSRRFHDASRAYFLITDTSKRLYVSRYQELKSKADDRKDITDCGNMYNLNCDEINYLFDCYFTLQIGGIWKIYEDDTGEHPSHFESVSDIGSSRYLKVGQNGFFYAYDLNSKQILNIEGAKDIRLNASQNLIFIYPSYIRHFRLNYLPNVLQDDPQEHLDVTEVLRQNYKCNAVKLPEFKMQSDSLNNPFIKFLLAYLDYELLKVLTYENIELLETIDKDLREIASFGSLFLNHTVSRLIKISQNQWTGILSEAIELLELIGDEQPLLPPHLLLIFDLAQLNLFDKTRALLENWISENRLITALNSYSYLKIGEPELAILKSFENDIKSSKQLEKFLTLILIWQELMNGSPYVMSKPFLNWQKESGRRIYEQFSNKLMLDTHQNEIYHSQCEKWDLETLPDLWYAFNVMDETHRKLLKDFVAFNQVNFKHPELIDYDQHLTEIMLQNGIDISRFNRENIEYFSTSSTAKKKAEAIDQIVNTLKELCNKLPKDKSFDLEEKLFKKIGVKFFKKNRISLWEEEFKSKNPSFFREIKKACTEVLEELIPQLSAIPKLTEKMASINKKLNCFDTREFSLQIWNRKPSSCLSLGRFAGSCISLDRPQKSAMIDYLADRSVELFPLIEKTQSDDTVCWGYCRMVLGMALIGNKKEKCILIDSIELAITTKDEITAAKESIIKMAKNYASSMGANFVLLLPTLYLKNTTKTHKVTFAKMGGCPFDRFYLHSFFSEAGLGWVTKSTFGEVSATSEFVIIKSKE